MDGFYVFTCDRLGCNKIVGAQRWEDDELVEEEWEETAVRDSEKAYCNKECFEKKDVFVELEEWGKWK